MFNGACGFYDGNLFFFFLLTDVYTFYQVNLFHDKSIFLWCFLDTFVDVDVFFTSF